VDLVPVGQHLIEQFGVAQSGTVAQSSTGYFLHQRNGISLGDKPTGSRNPTKAASAKRSAKPIWQLVCLTPKGEGKYAPTA